MRLKTPPYLVPLRLEPLQDLFESVQTRLAHAVQRVGAFDLAEVGRPVAARGFQDVRFAVHVLDHEALALERNEREGIQ